MGGSDSAESAKALGKVALRRKSCLSGYLGDPVIRIFQKLHAHLKPSPVQIADGRDSIILGKFVAQIIFIQMAQLRQGIQSDWFTVMGIQITPDHGALPGGMPGGNHLKGGICDPSELDGKYFQHVAADHGVSLRLSVQLLIDRVEIKQEICLLSPAVKNAKILLAAEREADPVHPHRIVAERDTACGNLCMAQMRIDNDQVVPGYGILAVVDKKPALSLPDIEQLRVVVGMRDAQPVLLIAGGRGAHQGDILRRRVARGETERMIAHRTPFLSG